MQDKCENLQNQMISYNNAELVKNLLANEKSQDTLVVFDADNVLLYLPDMKSKPLKKTGIKKFLDQKVGPEKAAYLMSILSKDSRYQIVESEMKDIVEDLQSKNVKVIVLTACLTGKFGVIESVQDFRIEQLKSLGYNFEKSWLNLEAKQLPDIYSDNYMKNSDVSKPSFKGGVICTDRGDKDKVLSEFLKYANFHPKKIVFIDDKVKYLQSVANMAYKGCIEFLGIEYTHAVSDQNVTLENTEIFDIQLDTLITEERWINNEEAGARITRSCNTIDYNTTI